MGNHLKTMRFDDDKVYDENEKDVSDEALALSKANQLIRKEEAITTNKEKIKYYSFLRLNSSPVRFTHKQVLLELYMANKFSWPRAKRVFILKHLTRELRRKLGDKIQEYVDALQREIEYEEIRLGNHELVTKQAIEQLELAKADVEDVDDALKRTYARVNLAKGYAGMSSKKPGGINIYNNNNIDNSKKHQSVTIYDGTRKLESTDKELEKIANRYGVTVGQAKQIGMAQLEAKRKLNENQPEVIDADTLE